MLLTQRTLIVTMAVAYALVAVPASGDEFQLANGGSVRGVLVNEGRAADEPLSIESDAGVTLTLDAAAVQRIEPQLPANEEYEKRRAAAPDTVDGQWDLAEWCHEQSLSRHRRVHLERVIELDPNHAQARRALEYFFRDGRWMTQDQINSERGLVRHNGQLMTPQKARILDDQQAQRQREGTWHLKLLQWKRALVSPRGEQAAAAIRGIDDPAAVEAIGKHLLDARSTPQQRMLAAESLSKIGTPAALELLASVALYDVEEELRLTATEHFVSIKSPDVVGFFVTKLRAKDPETINRAASVLAKLGDTAAVEPLIDVLVTVNRRTVTLGNPGSVGATFGDGGGGLSAGSKTVVVNDVSQNADVYEALTTLTGADFGYNAQQWKAWYASQLRAAVIDNGREGP